MLLGEPGLLVIEASFLELLDFSLAESPLEHRSVDLLGVVLIDCLEPQNTIGVDMDDDLDGRRAFGSRRDSCQLESSQYVIVLDVLIFAFVDGHQNHLLVLFGRCEGMLKNYGDRSVPGDEHDHRPLRPFNTQRHWEHVYEQQILFLLGVASDVLG